MMTDKRCDVKPDAFPEITVAVCVRNGAVTIRRCLDSLMALDYPGERITILVVDNGSSDETPSILNEYPITVVREALPGRGRARNAAWRNCNTPLIAFTDADCTASPDWLKQLVPVFADPAIGVTGGDIVTPGDDVLARFFETRQIVSNREFSGDYPYSPPFLATANAIFRREAIEQAGGFRTHYRVAEDADLCWRIRDLGWDIRYIPGAVIYHEHRAAKSGIFRQAVDYGHDGVAVYIAFNPHMRLWIWWGLYYRLLRTLLMAPLHLLSQDDQIRRFVVLDLIRYSGLAAGRILAGLLTFRFIL